MTTEHSVTAWIAAAKGGDEAAIEALVQRYFGKMVSKANSVYRYRFGDVPRPAEDEEDAALSALKSFWAHAANFTELTDRNDLWKLLATITIRKVYRQRRRVMGISHGSGKVQNWDPDDLDNFINELSEHEAAIELEDVCHAALDMLSQELKDVARLWLEGKSAKEIGKDLSVDERTIYRRLRAIREIWDEHFAKDD